MDFLNIKTVESNLIAMNNFNLIFKAVKVKFEMTKCIPIYLLLLLLTLSQIVRAGDFPCSATIVNTSNNTFLTFDNSGNTDSGVTAPPYGGYNGPDFWFSFVMTPNLQLILNGITMTDPAIAIYEGPCTNPKLLYNILDNNCDGSTGQAVIFDNLNVGQTYFMRVWPQNGTNNGTFSMFFSNIASPNPQFILSGSANQQEDCIQLTPPMNGQQGCAWYETPIDFTQPFTHTMTANFGNNNANGADGICLIYQTNGPTFCGGSGQGIGAKGMQNSAIFEFDTWQNPELNDPIQDHASFNINGNMNHNASIQGPISLGNIEDGNDHTITFSWDPSGNKYEVVFDGVIILSGFFDIINNCFGGNTSAWWGYTSATGAANNNHVICPEINAIEFGTQEYQEVEICEGDDFNGHTENGFYIDFIAMSNGCNHQINTLLTVHPLSDPTYVEATICNGDYYTIGGSDYALPGIYTINEKSSKGCDSLIILTLEVISGTISVTTSNALDCITGVTNLNASFLSIPNSEIFYYWEGPSGSNGMPDWTVSEAGLYSVSVSVFLPNENLTCFFYNDIEVAIDTTTPTILPIQNVTLTCNDTANVYLNAIPIINNNTYAYSWYNQGSYLGSGNSLLVTNPGEYILITTSNANGCSSIDTGFVYVSLDYTTIDIVPQKLNCLDTAFVMDPILNQPFSHVTWYKDSLLFSDTLNPTISEGGVYLIEVINNLGCKSTKQVVVEIDTIRPFTFLNDKTLECNVDTVSYILFPDSTLVNSWTNPLNQKFFGDTFVASMEGNHILEITNINNNCTSQDTFYISKKGKSPSIETKNDTLTCAKTSIDLIASSDQSNLNYAWSNRQNFISDISSPNVSLPGWYFIELINTNGCSASDSIYISENKVYPTIQLSADSLTCWNPVISINLLQTSADSFQWFGPNSFVSQVPSPLVSSSGNYYLTATNSKNGCTTFDSIEVYSNNSLPEFLILEDTLSCKKSTLPLPFNIASNYSSILWTGPSNFNSTLEQPNINLPGTYHLNITMTNGCVVDTFLEIRADFQLPAIDFDIEHINCFMPGKIKIDNSSNTRYFIFNNQNQLLDSSGLFVTNTAGIYRIQSLGINGCISDSIIIITEDITPPSATLSGKDIICQSDGSIIISETSGKIKVFDDAGNLIDTLPNIVISIPGQYLIEITGSNGCTTSIPYVVNRKDKIPDFTLIKEYPELNCDHFSMVLSASGAENSLIYEWSYQQNQYVGDSINVTSAGIYSVTGIDNNGCTSIQSIQITVDTISPVDKIDGNNLDCNNKIATLTLGNPSYRSITWSGPDINISNKNEIKVDMPGLYFVEFIGQNGCKSIDSIEVISNVTHPQLIYNGLETLVIDIDEIQGSVEIEILDSSEIISAQWNTEVGLICLNQDCSHMNITSGFLPEYTYSVTNEYGCTADLTIYLKAIEKPIFINIPNIIVPGSDSGNQFFTFYGREDLIDEIQNLSIFDRWGNLIFYKKSLPINIEEEGWDGLYNGVKVVGGVYIYTGSVLLKNGKMLYFHGDVTVLR
ncbi:MAG TPA: gliding motility-associated C-terminal domain-containing protein [Saprospiraceae bacterium]|nr:gliding motility-associated C-terminal domain-containing protein [Saprospiraceae bacterium]